MVISQVLQPSLIGYNCFFSWIHWNLVTIVNHLSFDNNKFGSWLLFFFLFVCFSSHLYCCQSALVYFVRGVCIPDFTGGTAEFICAMNLCRYLLCIQRKQACYATPCLNTCTLLCVVMKEYNSNLANCMNIIPPTHLHPSPYFDRPEEKKSFVVVAEM